MNKDQRGTARGPIPQPRIAQPKTVQRQPLQPVPHINQHSAHMQRVAQAKMAQTRTAPQQSEHLRKATQFNRPNLAVAGGVRAGAHQPSVQRKLRNSPVPTRPSGVVQPSCLSGVADFFGACWNGLTSCFSSPRREQYQEIPEIRSSGGISSSSSSVSRVVTPMRATLVDEEETANRLAYPGTLNAGLITSCALVIFCWDDSFDCYHAKGGGYKDNHNLRSNPTQIHYVYMAERTDKTETIEEYRRNAGLFRRLAGNGAPMTFRGQTDINHNILVDVHSPTDIRPKIGGWRM